MNICKNNKFDMFNHGMMRRLTRKVMFGSFCLFLHHGNASRNNIALEGEGGFHQM